MLTYNFDDPQKPLYEQLYMYIKKDIEHGILLPDEHLPSKRSFAKNLGVSTITVENAYDQLMSEGYMYSVAKKGYYVADIKDKNKIVKAVRINSDIKLPEQAKDYIYDLSGNQINPENFPFSVWARLMRET
ncbi:MAG: GntR family transcriptional regulator, partial [Lachnospiraceae bacterium]|nr:GntR family transcriptional regulator [Lachnospiraceae bacterium]